jgi:hypothetical protein
MLAASPNSLFLFFSTHPLTTTTTHHYRRYRRYRLLTRFIVARHLYGEATDIKFKAATSTFTQLRLILKIS